MLNIVIPMAGRGSRFQVAGFSTPKPLIPIHGVPMIQLVVENLRPTGPHRFIFLCLEEHLAKYDLERQLLSWAPASAVVPVRSVTEGAACTVLLARDWIDTEDPLMIANSDQWVDIEIDDYLQSMEDGIDGLIMTMTADDPKWSYVRFDEAGDITEVVEKQVVSHEATVGIYNYRQGADFVRAAERMIAQELRVDGEFYVAPVYNELLAVGSRIRHFNVGSEGDGMYGLGIPADLHLFESLSVSMLAASRCCSTRTALD